MKFLVISRSPAGSAHVLPDPIRATAVKNRLVGFIESGLVEKAFAIEGGGSAFIVNVPSQGVLTKTLREHPISLQGEIAVLPLRDVEALEPTAA